MARYTRVRREYVTGTSTSAASNGQASFDGNCSNFGNVVLRYQSLTLGPGSAGAVIFDGIPAAAQIYVFSVCGVGTAGTITMRISASVSGDFTDEVVLLNGPVNYPNSTCQNLCFQMDTAPPTQPCQYGVELQPQTPPVLVLTGALISLVTAPFQAAWLDIVLGALVGQTFDASSLCSVVPPPVPHIDTSTWAAGIQTVQQIFNYVAWFSFCQCKTGVPPPVPPTPTTFTRPIIWPDPPSPPAPPTDQTGVNTAVMQALQQLLAREQELEQLLTLIQRWHVPFGTVDATQHLGLQGLLTLQVSRIVGLRIEVLSQSATSSELFGNPPYITDLGWISVSDGGAMLQEIRIARGLQTWLPSYMQLATIVGVSLRPGVVANITELRVEP